MSKGNAPTEAEIAMAEVEARHKANSIESNKVIHDTTNSVFGKIGSVFVKPEKPAMQEIVKEPVHEAKHGKHEKFAGKAAKHVETAQAPDTGHIKTQVKTKVEFHGNIDAEGVKKGAKVVTDGATHAVTATVDTLGGMFKKLGSVLSNEPKPEEPKIATEPGHKNHQKPSHNG